MARPQTSYAPPASVRRRPKPLPLWQSALAWGLLAMPLLVFGLVWQRYAVNVPKWDDHALRAFLFEFDQETGIPGRIYQLFKQHNEHRIVYDRLVTLLDYELFGKLSYVHLMAVGNLSLIGLLAVFMAVIRRTHPARTQSGRDGSDWGSRSVLYAVPVALLLFNLSQWENIFWGMAALQNFSVVLWVVAAFYFLSYTHSWKLALLMAVLASLTSGNGLMVWPVGLVLLALRGTQTRRGGSYRLGPLVGWALGAVVVIGLYFVGFEPPGGTHAIRPGALALVKGWLAVVGAAAEALPFGSPLRNSMLLGCLMIGATFGLTGWGILAHWLAISRAFQRLWHPQTPASSGGASFRRRSYFSGVALSFFSARPP